MGEYFMHVNLDRHEYFMIDALGGATKSSGIGRNLGARALGLLLMRRGGDLNAHSLIGAWSGTRVLIVGDYAESTVGIDTPTPSDPSPKLYTLAQEHYTNLASSLALMLLQHDGPDELMAVAKHDEQVFVLLGELATVYRSKDADAALRACFGPEWTKDYAKKRKQCWIEVPPPLQRE